MNVIDLFIIMTTFVTSFINLDNDLSKNSSWRIDKFMDMVKTGIQLCVYADESVMSILKEKTRNDGNVRLMPTVILSELQTYRLCQEMDVLQLPYTDNVSKDTIDYLILTNSKIEFMYDAIIHNVWKSDYFAWIDFSIYHVFTDVCLCKEYLQQIQYFSMEKRKTGSFLLIPGCSPQLTQDEDYLLINRVYWRFCGGFFFGNKESIIEFYDYQRKYFTTFLNKYNTLVWEVNFWAWLEINTKWKPLWYQADHNDTILQIPSQYLSFSLLDHEKVQTKTYSYPTIKNGERDGERDGEEKDFYVPGSACYVRYNEKHLLNTRYINYSIYEKDDGEKTFRFHHPNKHIITKNVFSILDDNFNPLFYKEMKDPPENENEGKNNLLMFNGIEDIRLYPYLDEIHFIGTSMTYSSSGKNLMVKGKYNVFNFQLTDIIAIESPYNLQCEKNWTPIVSGVENEFFIYKWYPMEIGRLIGSKLQIEIIHNIVSPFFKKIRGSSPFIVWGEFLLGVVHFSEKEFLERNYFHALVMLDKITMKPLKYSDPFYFNNQPGIEFCIGFTIVDLKYQFWISQSDQNPLLLSIPLEYIPFTHKVY